MNEFSSIKRFLLQSFQATIFAAFHKCYIYELNNIIDNIFGVTGGSMRINERKIDKSRN